MNAHNCCSASKSGSENNAVPRLRAGFTDVLSTGIEIRWINVSVKPATNPPMPGANLRVVVNSTTITKSAVRMTSTTMVEPRP